ncbi:MAG: hypothetical protein ACLFQR_01300 [Desulfovibrionales bacterium]
MVNVDAIKRNLERDLESFMRNADALVSAAGEGQQEKLGALRLRTQESLDAVKRQYQLMGERVRPGVERTNERIRRHPYLTAGALTSGLAAIGFLVVSKSRRR